MTFKEITIYYRDSEVHKVYHTERGEDVIELTDEEITEIINHLQIYLDDKYK